MLEHGTVVDVLDGDDHDHDQGEDAVVVPGDLLDEQLEAVYVVAVNVAGNSSSPGGDRCDHADRSCGSVDNVSQLRSGDVVGLGDRSHNGAYGEAVEIVVYEDEDTQQHGDELCGCSALNSGLGPASECFGTAALVHQVGDDTEFDQEDDDAHVPGVAQNGQQTVVRTDESQDGLPGTELCIQQCADKAAEEQGGIHFLRDQCQCNGADRGKQGPERSCERSLSIFYDDGLVRIRRAQESQQCNDDDYGYQIGGLGAFLFHRK